MKFLYRQRKVLIESDWNLKGIKCSVVGGDYWSINRIRLEFKVSLMNNNDFDLTVLIESDWNLK